MGQLVDGKWTTDQRRISEKGEYIRSETRFRDWISADGSTDFPAESGRYHLYVSWACPWAHRTLVLRKLKHLEEVITLSVVDYFMQEDGWEFTENAGCIPDMLNGARYIREIYTKADPNYTGRASVPVLWDKEKQTIVNNESREIIRMFDVEFDALGDASVNFCPEHLKEAVEQTIDQIYMPINNGVYRAGFSRSQQAYEEAVIPLFEALDYWDEVLSRQRYLCGDQITEADWCLFTTLIRFDMVYYSHFKCNQRHIYEYPHLWGHLKELYQIPGVSETCQFDHIKGHYYKSHESVNPSRIIPVGPMLQFDAPHGRELF
ncbi:MAG: glutathione S-transferase family protein [SAR324 cluster bacterium]|nr:glutathione S-transferase family protein [SAR324 cluster bacterium]